MVEVTRQRTDVSGRADRAEDRRQTSEGGRGRNQKSDNRYHKSEAEGEVRG